MKKSEMWTGLMCQLFHSTPQGQKTDTHYELFTIHEETKREEVENRKIHPLYL